MTGSSALVGRVRERLLIDELVATAGKALVVTGEPGIGKTALLDYAAETARDAGAAPVVLRTRGAAPDAVVPFAALADVLLPLRPHFATLPDVQRAALEVSLALSAGPVPDSYAVCAGARGLLTSAAASCPVVVLVDDLQWLDPCSRRALLFAARRAAGTRIAMILADGGRDGTDLPAIEVPGLAPGEAAELLRRRGFDAAPQVAGELTRWSGGNPLALLGAASSMRPAQLRGDESMPWPLSAGRDLEQVWLARLDSLPAGTRGALAIMAAARSPSVASLAEALEAAGLSLTDLAPAEEAGLLAPEPFASGPFASGPLAPGRLPAGDGGYGFRRPVLRSVITRRTPLAERLRAYRVLADASAGTSRAWYLAAATTGPDEHLAASLAATALAARDRAAFGAAALAWRRSADITLDPGVRADRLLRAAADAFLAGSAARAAAWCEEALTAATDPPLRADIELLRGRVRTWLGHPGAAHEQLAVAAAAVRTADPGRACALLAEATLPAAMDNQIPAALGYAADCDELGLDAAIVSLPGSVTYGWVLILAGRVADGRAILDKWADALAAADLLRDQQLLIMAAQAHGWADNDGEARRLLTMVIDAARRHGAPAALPAALGARAELDRWCGRWAAAYADAADALRWAEELCQPSAIGFALAGLARLDAHRGDRARCADRVERARREAGPFAIGSLEIHLTGALGAAALAHGDYDTAVLHLESTFAHAVSGGLGNPIVVPYLADLAEAHVRTGNLGRADDVLGHLEEQARATELAWPQAAAARVRLLPADSAAAESWFEVADSARRRRAMPFEHARTQLCRGEVLRRSRRPAAARAPLLEAQATFESLGAAPWASRTAAELAATGRHRAPGSRANAIEELTAQELQVARAIAHGMSNDEAAHTLFVSRKTIEAHLTRVYRKLAIRSRTDLTRALVSAGLAE